MPASTQSIYEVSEHQKTDLLISLLKEDDCSHTLIFLRTRNGVHALTTNLHKAGILADSIHGNKKEELRNRAIKEFQQGKISTLVVTEAAGRDLELQKVNKIIQFEFHELDEDYLHRLQSLNTAQSEITTLVTPADSKWLLRLEVLLEEELPRKQLDNFNYVDKPQKTKPPKANNRKSSKERSKPLQHKKPKLINKNKPRRKTGRTSKR